MKSRTSFFNPTAFRKDVTRFAPAWGAYGIFLLLAVISMANGHFAYYRLQSVRDCIYCMSWINLIYAAVVAQLIFGDLFNGRMCNALHALPLRRECWFGTHVAAGFAFSLLPNLVLTLIALPVMRLESGWIAVFWWLLGAELQYIFFFGIAVLCVMLTGNRLGQIALYAAINFAGLLAYWMASAVYQPFLHGIQFLEEPFMRICPLAQIMQNTDVLIIDHERVEDTLGQLETFVIHSVKPGEGWGYMVICAGVGILALAAALALYRRRNLECTGDFVAFSSMEPAVTVIATIFAGGFFHLCADAFGVNLRSVMLGAGMVIGFFACRMLLERTTRVFRKKAFVFCGAIVVVFGLTVLLTYLDPIGITRYIPAMEDVESVTVSRSYSLYYHQDFPFVATSAEDIAVMQKVHADGIDRSSVTLTDETEEQYSPFDIRLEYKLKNGKTVNRFYTVHPKTGTGEILKGYFTRTECVMGVPASRMQSLAPYIQSIYTQTQEDVRYDLESLDLEGMLAAITADCAAGNMVQISGYHCPENYDFLDNTEYDYLVAYLEIGWDQELMEQQLQGHPDTRGYGTVSVVRYTNLRIYRSCENTLRWMEENGLLSEEAQQEMTEKFGGPVVTFTTGG